MAVLLQQVSAENENSLAVDGAAELDFAVDADDSFPAGCNGGGQPDGMAERVVADAEHGKTIDAADGGASGVDQDRAFDERFLEALLEEVVAVAAGLLGRADVGGGDDGMRSLPRAMRGFAHQIGNFAKTGGELILLL